MIGCLYCGTEYVLPGRNNLTGKKRAVRLQGGLCEDCIVEGKDPEVGFEGDLERYQEMWRIYLGDTYSSDHHNKQIVDIFTIYDGRFK